MIVKDKWFVFQKPNAQAKLRLFCFPYSGAGAAVFRQWPDNLPRDIEVCAIQLPGREARLRETPYSQIDPLIDDLMKVIIPFLDKPFVLFGHSLGALIIFELARRLRQEQQPLPLCLSPSARVAPQVPNRERLIYNLPRQAFVERLRRFSGTPDNILENKEMMDLLLPIIRADFEINETYVYRPEPPLPCPISAFRGAKDEIMTYDDVVGWRDQTSDSFMLRTLPGSHFFINGAQSMFWQIMSHDLRQVLSKC
jgi:medium-chain acyl-[acyl-carrier-protein] hydrolase